MKGNIDAHFIILENPWRQFQDILPDLGYSTASEFLRDMARVAVGEAPENRGNYWRTTGVTGRYDTKGLKYRLEKDVSQGEQNATGSPKRRTVQVHFNLPEKLWQLLLAKLPDLGYSTASEFFRARIREAIAKWSSQAKSFNLPKRKKANIAKELRQVETNRVGITEATGNEKTVQQLCRHKHDQCGCLRSTGKVTLLTMLIFSLTGWFYPLRGMPE